MLFKKTNDNHIFNSKFKFVLRGNKITFKISQRTGRFGELQKKKNSITQEKKAVSVENT